jgi:glycosyltransferase involved in cell wall biosynthesis
MTDSEPRRDPLRILGLSEGDSRTALSGVAGYVFDALDRRFTVVERIDYSAHGATRLALAAATFRPGRGAWRARFHASRLAHRMLSATLAGRLADAPEFDIALQVHGWVLRQPRPYALYIDQTRLMAERGWPSWIPLGRRERSDILGREREMYTHAAHVFAMGAPTRESLLADYELDPARVSVVGGGLNLAGLPAAEPLTLAPTILFVGRDFERKGGDCLLRVFEIVRREVPAATLHVVGVARNFGVPGVISHGKLSNREELVALYRESRVFCMPSRYEPWGLVFPEAMAYGVPCVGSTVQSIPDILGDAGILVAPDDPPALADALLRVLTDDAGARELGAAGRRRVEQLHTWDHVAERMAPALLRTA